MPRLHLCYWRVRKRCNAMYNAHARAVKIRALLYKRCHRTILLLTLQVRPLRNWIGNGSRREFDSLLMSNYHCICHIILNEDLHWQRPVQFWGHISIVDVSVALLFLRTACGCQFLAKPTRKSDEGPTHAHTCDTKGILSLQTEQCECI